MNIILKKVTTHIFADTFIEVKLKNCKRNELTFSTLNAEQIRRKEYIDI